MAGVENETKFLTITGDVGPTVTRLKDKDQRLNDGTIKRNNYNIHNKRTNLNYMPSKYKTANRSEKR